MSEGTFLGDKVKNMKIGYVVDSMNEDSVWQFLDGLSISSYMEKLENCYMIEQEDCIDKYPQLFHRLEELLK